MRTVCSGPHTAGRPECFPSNLADIKPVIQLLLVNMTSGNTPTVLAIDRKELSEAISIGVHHLMVEFAFGLSALLTGKTALI